MNYYKILSRDEKHYEMQYHTGLNINCEEFNPKGNCTRGGMYFSREDILAFLEYGPWIRQVTLCPDSKVYRNPGEPVKWKTDKFILGERRKITLEVIKELIEEGANIHADHDMAVRWASTQGHLEIVKLLIKHGADVHVFNEYAFKCAVVNGHLKIVKLLIEHGADINITNDYALKSASDNGHLEIVKLLIEHGAVFNENALKCAVANGHLEIVKLLIKHRDRIHMFNKHSLKSPIYLCKHLIAKFLKIGGKYNI